MFTATSQSAGGEKHGQTQLPVEISSHAQKQWAKRTPADISLKTAWEQSVPVEAPEADSTAARLYPPSDALMLVQHTTVTTVLNNDGRLNTPGLDVCAGCDGLLDPVEADTCPWCGEAQAETARPGRVTITQGDI